MTEEKTSTVSNSWLWLGAAISISEILTGTFIAPLGMAKGLLSILIGHLIGGVVMYFAGKIGADTGMNAMETLKISFGSKGGLFFSVLNVLQLVGWTAVMVVNGASAIKVLLGMEGSTATVVASLLIGGLILIWMALDVHAIAKVNSFSVIALLVLCLLLTYKISQGAAAVAATGEISFGAAIELSVAMPLSWVPVIADYTRTAKNPRLANGMSNLAYFIGSCWMFIIGLGAAVFTGYQDVAQLMSAMGLGITALLIVILSTVTTTYLDARSAAISFRTISDSFSEKTVGLAITVIGTIIGCFVPIMQFENFLYLIGSCFIPMIAILITDYFLLKKQTVTVSIDKVNLLLWFAGFLVYRLFLSLSTPVGTSLPVIVLVMLLSYVINGKRYKNQSEQISEAYASAD